MFFSSYSNTFKKPAYGKYCSLEFAREIQEVSDLPPCPVTGLKEEGLLRVYYNQLLTSYQSAQPIRAMQRNIGRMPNWACGLYLKAAKHNWPIKQKMRLLSDPKIRVRVLAELGGEPALQRWERLQAKAAAIRAKPATPDTPLSVSPAAKGQPGYPGLATEKPDNALRFRDHIEGNYQDEHYRSHTARTDSRGEFRLAPIPRVIKPDLPKRVNFEPKCRIRRTFHRNYPPVPLLPHELRGHDCRTVLAAFKARYHFGDEPLRLTYKPDKPNAPPEHKGPP